jgi:peroxiredoxin
MLIVVVALLASSVHSSAVVTHRRAPNVELRGPKGTRVRLADYKGKLILIKFWASWCPQCAESFASLNAIDRDYRSKGVEVLAVNVDEHRKDADAFLNAHPGQVRVLFDSRARAFEAFEATGVPVGFLIDRRGIIRHLHEGDDGDDSEAAYRAELDALLAEPVR